VPRWQPLRQPQEITERWTLRHPRVRSAGPPRHLEAQPLGLGRVRGWQGAAAARAAGGRGRGFPAGRRPGKNVRDPDPAGASW